MIARRDPQGSDEGRSARVKRELLAETNEFNITSELLFSFVRYPAACRRYPAGVERFSSLAASPYILSGGSVQAG